jgi:uncharacterized protein (UPF0276 family)
MRESLSNIDTSFLGLHCGYSVEKCGKVHAGPNEPLSPPLSEAEVFDSIVNTLLIVKNIIGKNIAIENIEKSRARPDLGYVKNPNKYYKGMSIYDITNATTNYVTDPKFIKNVADTVKCGLVADIGHGFITADAEGISPENYFSDLLSGNENRVYEVHLTSPRWYDSPPCWKDDHDEITDKVIELAKPFFKAPNLELITMERRNHKDLNPKDFAKQLVKEAEIIAKYL